MSDHFAAARRVEWEHDRLSPHFVLGEFAVSRDFPELAHEIGFSEAEVERIRHACVELLEPLRAKIDRPILILSGKRSPELNAAVGGHPESHHLFHRQNGAVDIAVDGMTSEELAAEFIEASAGARFQYVIKYPGRGFIHISFYNGQAGAGELRTKR